MAVRLPREGGGSVKEDRIIARIGDAELTLTGPNVPMAVLKIKGVEIEFSRLTITLDVRRGVMLGIERPRIGDA